MAFEDLYQEIIMDHYRHPHHFGEIEAEEGQSAEHENPTCGDRFEIMAIVDDEDRVEEVRFHGSGCAISTASASMMTDAVMGKAVEEVKEIIDNFVKVMRGELEADILEQYGDLMALQGVIQFPVRIKCATLAWHGLEQVIEPAERKEEE